MSRIREFLERAVAAGSSDLHIIVGLPPLQRIHTVLGGMEGEEPVGVEQATESVRDLLTEDQYKRFLDRRDIDFSTALPSGVRFRVNAHFQRGTPALSFRTIPGRVPQLATLNLPPVVTEFADLP